MPADTKQVAYEAGDRIRFRDDETHDLHSATVLEHHASSGWYEVAVDGITDDTWSICPSLIQGLVPDVPAVWIGAHYCKQQKEVA